MPVLLNRFKSLLIFYFFLLGFSIDTQAQIKTGFESKINCLNVVFQPYGIDSACETIAWFIGNSSTPNSRDYYFNYTFNSAGTYKVCMQVYNFCSKKDSTYCKEITVKDCASCDTIKTSIKITADTTKCGAYRFIAYPNTNNNNNFTYKWNFGEGTSATSRETNFQYTQNGTYKACANIYYQVGTQKCESILCETIVVNCYKTNKCRWENVGIGHSISNDICGKVIFEANAVKDSCIITEYYFDGKWYSGRIFDHRFSTNGSYKYGFRYKNQCTGCDTTLYKWVEIGCFPKKTCDWSKMNFEYVNYAANSGNCRKYVFEAKNYEDSCIVQKIKIVSGNDILYQETGRVHYYTFKNDGYYNVCFWAKNECLNCDTWVCKTVYVNCENASAVAPQTTSLKLFPNPVESTLNLEVPLGSRIDIFDYLGRWKYRSIGINKTNIEVSNWSEGLYIVEVQEQDGSKKRAQFIKK